MAELQGRAPAAIDLLDLSPHRARTISSAEPAVSSPNVHRYAASCLHVRYLHNPRSLTTLLYKALSAFKRQVPISQSFRVVISLSVFGGCLYGVFAIVEALLSVTLRWI